ncbi:MAG: O-antigen ligase family protein [Saprospiraceae bacterium]
MSRSIKVWLNDQLFWQKLNNPVGFILLTIIALVVSYLTAMTGMKFGFLILGAAVAIPLLGACFLNHRFGILFIVTISFFIEFVRKHTGAPVGTALDGLIFVMFFGILVKQIKERDLGFANSPISVLIIVWIFYNLIQVINPWAASKMAWMYTVRSVAVMLLLYFIACYAFKDLKTIMRALKLILLLGVVTALYGFKQEFFGYSAAEMAWLYEDEERFQLIYQWGRLRPVSLFADPTTFGILMAYLAIFCLIMMTGPISWAKRLILLTAAGLMFMAMAFGGSRTPVVLIPFGFFIFMIMTLKPKIMIPVGIFLMMLPLFFIKRSSNPILYRIQSSFDMQSDASVKVRMKNQKFIQPYIQTHPFGAGLGSTGLWGRRFTPDSFLAKFAHDSGFVRIAVELGWVGLLIYMALLFTVLKTVVYYYIRVRDPMIKTVYLGLANIMFILALASYPQEAILQLPTSIVFYICLAAIVKLKDFDPAFNPKLAAQLKLAEAKRATDQALVDPSNKVTTD